MACLRARVFSRRCSNAANSASIYVDSASLQTVFRHEPTEDTEAREKGRQKSETGHPGFPRWPVNASLKVTSWPSWR